MYESVCELVIVMSVVKCVEQGCARDYRGAGTQSQKRAVHAKKKMSGLNNTIYGLINVKLINKVLIES